MVDGLKVLKQFDSQVTAVINGEEFGPFDEFSPPEVSGNTERYRPGGQQTAVRTRGLVEFGTGELTKSITSESEYGRFKRLHRVAGRASMSVIEQPLDDNGDPLGESSTWDGLLDDVEFNDVDADSADNRTVTLTFAPNDGIA